MEKHNNIPVFEFIFNTDLVDEGLTAVSIVDQPAILQEFLMFNKETTPLKFTIQSEEQQTLVGPALISGMLVYRKSKIKGEYYGFFSKETIKQLVEYYFSSGKINNFTYQHENENLSGLSIIESWFTDGENDKSVKLGYNLPSGSWMISVKVQDKELWNKIKLDGLKGFSVEVFVDALPHQMKFDETTDVLAKVPCQITNEMVLVSKLKKIITEKEVNKLDVTKDVYVERWNSSCRCNKCKELKKLGYCLPNVLPSGDTEKYFISKPTEIV